MKKFFQIILALGTLAALLFTGWYYQPWSDYSPAKIAALQNPDKFPQIFQHFDEYLPYRPIPPSNQPRPLKTALMAPPESFLVDGKSLSFDDYHTARKSTSLVVLKDGVIVHEQYFLGADDKTTQTSWSVAKSFVATAIFKALKEGLITSLDDKAAKYAPKYAGTDFGKTSLRGLLAMSSGIAFDEDYSKDNSDIRRFFFDAFIARIDVDELLQPYKKTRDEFKDFTYISPNSQVLSAVLRGIYGKPLAEILSTEIWKPLGLADAATWAMHRPGHKGVALGYCCLNATAKDYARFGQFWLETLKGEGQGTTMMPENIRDLILKPASVHHFPNTGRYGDRGYSHHFWMAPNAPFNEKGEVEEFFAAGVYGQYIWVDVARNIVIARTAGDPVWIDYSDQNFAFFRTLSKHYGG